MATITAVLLLLRLLVTNGTEDKAVLVPKHH